MSSIKMNSLKKRVPKMRKKKMVKIQFFVWFDRFFKNSTFDQGKGNPLLLRDLARNFN